MTLVPAQQEEGIEDYGLFCISFFSTGGKFCPDYGLLLELHALTLVAHSYALLLHAMQCKHYQVVNFCRCCVVLCASLQSPFQQTPFACILFRWYSRLVVGCCIHYTPTCAHPCLCLPVMHSQPVLDTRPPPSLKPKQFIPDCNLMH